MTDPTRRLGPLAEAAGLQTGGPSKVTTLSEAIAAHVKPRMHVHLASGLTRPSASCYEILRRFRGRRPAFTLSVMSMAGPHVLLVHEGLVEHLICTFHGDTLPTPGPNPLLQQAHADGRLTVTDWSILSFTQALLAGALRLPFMPTNSLAGSSLADSGEVALEVDGTTAVRAIRPDVALVHAAAADPCGNTLLGGPLGDEALGAWAAREGAIVTVERIVPTEVVAAHPGNMRIPGALVRAVVEAPFGSHPGPLFSGGVEDLVPPIAEDVAFVLDFRDACRDPEAIGIWSKEWVHGGSHASYVARLGAGRLSGLRGRAQPESWREDVAEHAPRILRTEQATDGERAVVAGARVLAERMRERGLTTVLAGVGMSNLAAWLARAWLARDGVAIDLMVELGLFGYVPPPGDPLLVSNRVAATARGLGGVLDILGLSLAATPSAGILGAGQVDRTANLNSSRTADGRLLVGSGGANDVASICRDVVVVCHQGRGRFVERVPYVTAPGERIGAVATPLGCYERRDGDLVLTGVFGPVREGVARARAACGWDLATAPRVARIKDPARDELALLRAYDPLGLYTG